MSVVRDEARQLCDRYWGELLRLDPLLATSVGDERYDDRLPDPSDDGLADRARVHQAVLRDLGRIERRTLDPILRVTLEIAEATATDELAALRLRIDRLHHVDHLYGPVALPGQIAGVVQADTPERLETYLARLAAIEPYVDAVIGQMRTAEQERGAVAPLVVVDRVIAQTERLLATPAQLSPFASPVPENDADGHARVRQVIERQVVAAYGRYLAAVRDYRRSARPTIGLVDVLNGAQLYASAIRRWTTGDFAPGELHERGREELARIAADRRQILRRLGANDVAGALDGYDRRLRAQLIDRAAVLDFVRAYVERGWEGARPFFGRIPGQNCEVRLVEEFREADYPGAYYEPPSGERRGRYYVNAAFYLEPTSRLLHRLATTTYHEANPGHHFQIALEQEQKDAPALRRFVGSFRGDAFTEGWGLYAERLADEIGLYQDDYERLGMLDNDTLRAVRLVVDTGIHALGWDRDRGIAEMTEVGIPPVEAEIEIDRYAVDPAQALCYKVGELELRRFRDRFATDGRREALTRFHDRLLALGALPLATIERELERAYAEEAGTSPVERG